MLSILLKTGRGIDRTALRVNGLRMAFQMRFRVTGRCESRSRLLVDALQHNAGDLQKLLPLYALLSRIRLSSLELVLRQAEKVIRTIISTYPQPNLTPEQIESEAANGKDPLRQFSDTCRSELDSLQQQL